MTSRTSLATVCLVLVVAASLPAGAYAGAPTSGSTANASIAQDEDPYPEECLSTSGLENVTMNAHRQEATNLRTRSANVSSTGNGTTAEAGLIGIESGYIEGNETCFDRISTENETMQIALEGVEFENTSLRGPWTNIEFRRGEADSMTVVLPGDEFLSVLRQMHVGDAFIDLFKDMYDLSGTDDEENTEDGSENDDSSGDSDDPADNGTDPGDSDGDTDPDNSTDNDTESGDPGDNVTDPGDPGDNVTDPGDPGDNVTDPGDPGDNVTDPDDPGDNVTDPGDFPGNITVPDDLPGNFTAPCDGSDDTTPAINESALNTSEAIETLLELLCGMDESDLETGEPEPGSAAETQPMNASTTPAAAVTRRSKP